MKTSNLIINVSMLGPSPTGIGVYSQKCAAVLEHYFNCTVISSYYKSTSLVNVQSPKNIAIGAPRGAALKRIFYSWRGFPKLEGLVYTPTHHGIIGRKKQVITILDLIPLRFPSQHRLQYYYFKFLLPKIMRNSLAVFTISESVKNEIIEYYKFPREKIYVVPCGLDQEKYFPVVDEKTDKKPYLLVVGAAYYHKNIQELLDHYLLWKNKYDLKIVGSRGAYREYLVNLVEQYQLQNSVEFTGYLSDTELVKTMQGCKALVYPSLCEGFGMPPLEVMACGRPVIISDLSVHKEVCADVPMYITPGNSESWAHAFYLLEDRLYLDNKIAEGLELVKRCTWQKSGEMLIDALLQVMPKLAESKKQS